MPVAHCEKDEGEEEAEASLAAASLAAAVVAVMVGCFSASEGRGLVSVESETVECLVGEEWGFWGVFLMASCGILGGNLRGFDFLFYQKEDALKAKR